MFNKYISILCFIFIVLLVFSNYLIAQVIVPLGGTYSRINALSMAQMPNGDFTVLCHESTDSTYRYGHPRLIRIDNTGEIIWQKAYPQFVSLSGSVLREYRKPYSDLQITSQGYIFSFKDTTSFTNLHILEIDWEGKIIRHLPCGWVPFPFGTAYNYGIPHGFGDNTHPKFIITPTNNYIFSSEGMFFDQVYTSGRILFTFCLDGVTGDTLWTKQLTDLNSPNTYLKFLDFLITPDSNLLICYTPDDAISYNKIGILLLDIQTGQEIWKKEYASPRILINPTPMDYVTGVDQGHNSNFLLKTAGGALWKLDSLGNIVDSAIILEPPVNPNYDPFKEITGNFVESSNEYFFAQTVIDNSSNIFYPYIQITDSFGLTKEEYVFRNLANYNIQQGLRLSSNKYAFISTMISAPNPPTTIGPYSNSFFYIGDTLGEVHWGLIEGHVFNDEIWNCSLDSTERGLSNYIIEFRNSSANVSFWVHSDSLGFYSSKLIHGNYESILYVDTSVWQNCLSGPVVFSLDSINLRDTIDWGIRPKFQCPILETSITNVLIRRCLEGRVLVTCSNNSPIDAVNSYVDVQLDDYLIYNSHSPAMISVDSSLGNNTYRFLFDTLLYGQTASILINVTVSCDAYWGQVHCNEAYAFPDTSCIWDGSILTVRDTCFLFDTSGVYIYNIGGDMATPTSYQLLKDSVLIRSGTIQLLSGDKMNIAYPIPDSHAYWLVFNQEVGFPEILGDSVSRYFLDDNCTDIPPPMSILSNSFINNNNLSWSDIACGQNTGSYDPNRKIATPIGIGTNHQIAPNSLINYTIQFQNTGNDTAFLVRIKDTLSEHLDISSLQVLGASHPFRWTIQNENVLSFIFEDIQLVDSSTNEPASHGFISFRIKPKSNTPLLTDIYNKAAIYFDFNEPIITNNIHHQLGIGSLLSKSGSIPINFEEELFSLYPNPSNDKITIDLKKDYLKSKVYLQSINGHLIDIFHFDHEQFLELNISKLPSGIYILQIVTKDKYQTIKFYKY